MRVVMFYHSLVSDWNHGNAHFLRGVATELLEQGHDVHILESRNAWSTANLVKNYGPGPLTRFRSAFPRLESSRYRKRRLDLDRVLHDADLVLVHEWNDPGLVAHVGRHRALSDNYTLLFHDTHHRSVTCPGAMESFDLSRYDGTLAFGEVIRDLYLQRGWTPRAFTWHEAADTRVFHPRDADGKDGDVVWIGNWGDEERTAELEEFLCEPVQDLGLMARVHGVRYPRKTVRRLRDLGIDYAGWIPNYTVPDVFARYRATVHVPRRPYVDRLPGIPTIRVFEALASGIPLVSARWIDSEGLFTEGRDYLVAEDGDEMREHLRTLLTDEDAAAKLRAHGLRTIRNRHTCAHRVRELMDVHNRLQSAPRRVTPARTAAEAEPVEGCLRIAFFVSSLVSSYWNGAATYYRGLAAALHARGHRLTFYEPDVLDRQKKRDMEDPEWARIVVYPADGKTGVEKALADARSADVVVKTSGVGVFDDLLAREVLALKAEGKQVAYWDVDAPATLEEMRRDPNHYLRPLIPEYDLVLTYGGGDPVVRDYESFGAKRCVPVYNALDPSTHFPTRPDPRYEADLGFLGNRLPDREARVEEFFLKPAHMLPDHRFLLGGSGWDDKPMPGSVNRIGHVGTRDHNAFNSSPRAVLNIARESMAKNGFSPATRVFEAAGAGTCIITDHWEGIDHFLEPGREILVARDGAEVARLLRDLDPLEAHRVGARARRRILREHTYRHRAAQVEELLTGHESEEVDG